MLNPFLVSHNLGLELLDNDLLLQIPDLDDGASGSTEPVSVGREGESVDLVTSLEGVKGLGLLGSNVPELGLAVSATGSAEGTVGGDVDGVEVASVASVVSLQLAVGKVPDL